MQATSKLWAISLLILLSLLWSSSYIFVKIAGHDFDPVTLMAGRALFGCLFLWAVVILTKKPLCCARSLKVQVSLVISSAMTAFMWFTMAYAETGISASMTAFMMTFLTVSSWLIATFITREKRFHLLQLIGILIALVGTATMLGYRNIVEGHHSVYYASIYMLGLFIFSGSVAINKRFAAKIDICVNTAFTLTYVTLFLGAASLLSQTPLQHHYHVNAILAVLAIGILSTGIGYIIFFWLAHEVGHVFACLNGYLVPIFTFLGGILLLGETVHASQLIGLGIAFIGVFLTNK